MVGCTFDAYWNMGIIGKVIAPISYLVTRHYNKHSLATIYVTNKYLQDRYPTKGLTYSMSDVIICEHSNEILNKRINKINSRIENGKIRIGTIGSLDVKYKGQQYIIRAISYLRKKGYNIEYQLVGSGDSKMLNKIAERFNIEESIKYLGPKPHSEIFKWLDEIDIYIQPSNVEGLCRALIEAMSRACPCIASSVGGNKELLDPKDLFKKKKYKQAAAIIEKMTNKKMHMPPQAETLTKQESIIQRTTKTLSVYRL